MRSLNIITSHICGVSEGKTVYYCGYCFQQFSTPKDLRLHVNSDHNAKKYRCYICPDYRHNTLDWVVEHLYKTHGIKTETYKEVKCSQDNCDYRSLTGGLAQLNWHNKTVHSEEYQDSTCKICGKRLQNTCALRTHVEQVHMKIKPFQCDQCPIGKLYFWAKYQNILDFACVLFCCGIPKSTSSLPGNCINNSVATHEYIGGKVGHFAALFFETR